MQPTVDIISTGSIGNATVINDKILIDCGVPYYQLKRYEKALKAVFLTHIHSDHFKAGTISRLALNRPTLRFICCRWLVQPLIDAGVEKRQIDCLDVDKWYNYGMFKCSPFALKHDVENCGWRIFTRKSKILYATDTHDLDNVTAKDYDMYLVERNYGEEEIAQRIKRKKERGLYAYEEKVLKYHMSFEDCNSFLVKNMGEHSAFVYMHQHLSVYDKGDDGNAKGDEETVLR